MIKRIAVSSIMMALCVVCLFVGSILPVSIAMCVMASLIICVIVLECGHKYAWLTFIGAALISFLLIPKKLIVYAFIGFLGFYPILKLYIERTKNIYLEWLFKILCFNVFLILAYFILNRFLLPSLDSELIIFAFKYIAFIIAVLEAAFVVYDLGLSYFIGFYIERLRRFFKL